MMKKNFFYAMMSAIALTGAMGFTACTSDEDVVAENNPTYDEVAKTVTTQFVLNVSSAANSTRMSSATVQRDANFRGLKDAKLIGLSTGHSNYLAPYNGEATGSFAVNKTYDLGTLYAASAVNNEGSNNRDNSSRRVLQLTLPLQTDAMLVYARAIPNGTDEENGKVSANITSNPENITFDLVSRLGGNGEKYLQTQNMVAAIINRVMSCSVSATANYEHETNHVTNSEALPALSWSGLGAALAGGGLTALEEQLARAYNAQTTLGTGEYRAGCAQAIKKTMYDLHHIVSNIYNAEATGDAELNAQRLAHAIKTRIEKYFGGLTAENTTTFHSIGEVSSVGTIAGSLKEGGIVTDQSDYNTKFGLVTLTELGSFPASFGLPEGAAQLSVADGVFSYKTTNNSLLGSGTISANQYMYPSELLYFDNSALRVNNAEKSTDDYPNGYSTWNTDSWTGWTVGKVVSSTRSVAVKNNINYGVAMLKSTVSLNGTEFHDNRSAIVTTEEDQVLDDTDVSKFTLTGVLIGGQNKQLGWNYLAKDPENVSTWNYVIYDNKIPASGVIPTSIGNENYTLVFDNYNSTIGTQSDVYVALEFVNNSEKAFYGRGNIVPVGSTFYLVAKLALGSNTIAAWDANYAIPPYTAAGASQQITRIFVQDYMTSANFKFGINSLKNAFVTMPDLRSTQTSLGLSVDLNWQTGLSFETTLGD